MAIKLSKAQLRVVEDLVNGGGLSVRQYTIYDPVKEPERTLISFYTLSNARGQYRVLPATFKVLNRLGLLQNTEIDDQESYTTYTYILSDKGVEVWNEIKE